MTSWSEIGAKSSSVPPDDANTAGCTNLCRGRRFTSSTSSRAALVDRQSSTISRGPVRAAICISPIASRRQRLVSTKRCHSSIHAPTNGATTSAGTAATSPGSRQSVEQLLTCFCSIKNGGLGFVKLKHCSISSPRAMSRHNHSPYGLTASSSSGLTRRRPRRNCTSLHPHETYLGSSPLMLKRASGTSTDCTKRRTAPRAAVVISAARGQVPLTEFRGRPNLHRSTTTPNADTQT